MKKFTIEVSHAAPGQLLSIAAELKIMCNSWARFGPRIYINSKKLQAPSLREPSHKRQASSSKRIVYDVDNLQVLGYYKKKL